MVTVENLEGIRWGEELDSLTAELTDPSLLFQEVFEEDMNVGGAAPQGGNRGAARWPQMHVPPYDGDPRKLRAFRKTMDVVFSANPGITEQEKLALTQGLLCEDAMGWFLSKPDDYAPGTWGRMLDDLQQEMFGGSTQALWTELQHRVLKAGESLNTYKFDLANLCQMLRVQEVDQVGYFLRGLPESLKIAVASHSPATLDAAFRIAQRVNEYANPGKGREWSTTTKFSPIFGASRRAESPRREEYVEESKGVNKEIVDLTQQLSKLTLHLLKEKEGGSSSGGMNRGQRSFGMGSQPTMICGKCLKSGHMQRACPNPPDPAAVRCNNCTFYGHQEAECRKPKRPGREVGKTNFMAPLSGLTVMDDGHYGDPVSAGMVYDEGHEDGEMLASIPHSGLMSFTLEGDTVMPPVEVSLEGEVFSGTVKVDPLLPTVQAQPAKGRKKKGGSGRSDGNEPDTSEWESPSDTEGLVDSHLNQAGEFPGESVRRRTRAQEPPKKSRARVREEVEEEDKELEREHRKELREERKNSTYKVLDALLGPKMPALTEVMKQRPYGRKDSHVWWDQRVLHYESRKRRTQKSAYSELKPSGQEDSPTSFYSGHWSPGEQMVVRNKAGQLIHILARVGNVSIPAVVDTGSQISVVSLAFLREIGMEHEVNTRNPPRFTGSDLQSHMAEGTIGLVVNFGRVRVQACFTVVDGPSSSYRMLIGTDVLRATYASIDNESREIKFKTPGGVYVHCPFMHDPKNSLAGVREDNPG